MAGLGLAEEIPVLPIERSDRGPRARTGHFEITSDTVNETADYPEALLPNYVAEIEDFQRAVATGGQPAATGLDGLRVVEVTLAMIESARTRRSVKIERVEP